MIRFHKLIIIEPFSPLSLAEKSLQFILLYLLLYFGLKPARHS
jgi:hypothetical protein